MGVDGGEYSFCRKRSVGFGGHVCRAGFLCETALGDFRVGDAIKNGTRQSRAPLRAVARTRAPAERPVSLDDRITDCLPCRLAYLAEITGGGSRHSCGVGGSGVRRQVDLTLLASISSRLFFVCVAVSETLEQLRYEQQRLSAPVGKRTQRVGDVPCVAYAAASHADRS